MPQIPNILNSGQSTPILGSSQLSTQGLDRLESESSSRNAGLINQQMSQFKEAENQAQRSHLLANEAEFNNQFSQLEAYNKINQAKLNALNIVASIDEEERKAQEKQASTAYLINETSATDNDLLAFKQSLSQQVPADGSGYQIAIQKYLQERTVEGMKRAPNSDARLTYYGKMSEASIKEAVEASKFEEGKRKSFQLQQLNGAYSNLSNHALNDPLSAERQIAGSEYVKQNFILAGMDPNEANKQQQKVVSNILLNSVQGLINNGFINDAVDSLHNDSYINRMDENDYAKAQNIVIAARRADTKEQAKKATLAIDVDQFDKHLLNEKDKGFDAAADAHFQQTIGDLSTIQSQDIAQAAQNIHSYFSTHWEGIGKNTQETMLNNLRAGSNPNATVAIAKGLSALVFDQDNPKGPALFNKLPEDAKVLAIGIANLANSGVEQNEAVSQIRKALNESKLNGNNADTEQLIKQNVTFEKVSSMLESATDTITKIYPTAQANMIVPEVMQVFSNNMRIYKNEDLANAATQAYVKGNYTLSNINGVNTVMKGAPETIFTDDELNIVKDQWAKERENLSNILGLKLDKSLSISKVGLKDIITGNLDKANLSDVPFEAVTSTGRKIRMELRVDPNNIAPAGSKAQDYYVYDSYTQSHIQDKDGNYVKIRLGVDNTEYGNKIKNLVAEAATKRELINQQAQMISENPIGFSGVIL